LIDCLGQQAAVDGYSLGSKFSHYIDLSAEVARYLELPEGTVLSAADMCTRKGGAGARTQAAARTADARPVPRRGGWWAGGRGTGLSVKAAEPAYSGLAAVQTMAAVVKELLSKGERVFGGGGLCPAVRG